MHNSRRNNLRNNRTTFLRFMRYMSVSIVTAVLLLMAVIVSPANNSDSDFAIFIFIFIAGILFFITIPIIGFWIYSLVKSVKGQTKTDRLLLYLHIADILLLGLIIYLGHRLDCNAEVMVEHYEKYAHEMRNVAKYARDMIPDVGGELVYEFGDNHHVSHNPVPSDRQLNDLRVKLDSIDSIGIETDNQGRRDYTAIRFRRKGMGMYSFRLYDIALTPAQRDSMNDNECLIVYNDSTVFEFGGGAVGVKYFVGKQEFLDGLDK